MRQLLEKLEEGVRDLTTKVLSYDWTQWELLVLWYYNYHWLFVELTLDLVASVTESMEWLNIDCSELGADSIKKTEPG